MIGFPSQSRIYLRRVPTDMRKSFDGLSGLVRNEFMRDPLTGDVFVFMNRRRDLLKALYWERDGFALWCKRLERGRFVLPSGEATDIDRTALTLLLEGVKARVVFRSPRYQVSKKEEETNVR
jgi:transposase